MKTNRDPFLLNISTENVPPCWVPVSGWGAVSQVTITPPPLNSREVILHIYLINCVRSTAVVAVFFAPARAAFLHACRVAGYFC